MVFWIVPLTPLRWSHAQVPSLDRTLGSVPVEPGTAGIPKRGSRLESVTGDTSGSLH